MYCTTADILFGDPKLADSIVDVNLEPHLVRAEAIVRQDLACVADMEAIDQSSDIPPAVKLLTESKGKELAYRDLYRMQAPEKSEIDRHRADYERRLEDVRSAVRDGALDSRLRRIDKTLGQVRAL